MFGMANTASRTASRLAVVPAEMGLPTIDVTVTNIGVDDSCATAVTAQVIATAKSTMRLNKPIGATGVSPVA